MLLLEAFVRGLEVANLSMWLTVPCCLALCVAALLSNKMTGVHFLKLLMVFPAAIVCGGLYAMTEAPNIQAARIAVGIAYIAIAAVALFILLVEKMAAATLEHGNT